MDFALSEEQDAIFDMARAFGEAEIAPHAQAWDKAGEIPKDLWPKLAELGFGGLYVSERARRLRPDAARCDAGLRGAEPVLRLGRGLPVDPQHVRADAGKLRRRRLARPASATRAEDGDLLCPTA
jgi:alkylation response protein AidB-like acyl-CoA dehydrogenase